MKVPWYHDEFAERFGRKVLERYADLVLRAVHALGGRDRFVAISEIQEKYKIESPLVLYLCEEILFGEILVTHMPPADLDESSTYRDAVESFVIKRWCVEPHARIRPPEMRLTEKELLDLPKSGRRRGPRRG